MWWFPVVATLLLAFSKGAVGSEESTCYEVEGLASNILGQECGCSGQYCTCTYMDDDHATAICVNGCEYCAYGLCGVYSTVFGNYDDTEDYGDFAVSSVPGLTWTYTRGRSGVYLFYFPALVCSAKFDSVACSCEYIQCSDGTYNAYIDCSNIEAGATANYCLSDLGITSTDHLLIFLRIPGADCSNTTYTSENPASQPVAAPTSVVASPTAVTSQPITASPTSTMVSPTTPQPITSTGISPTIPPSQPSTGSPVDMSSTTIPAPQPSTVLPIASTPTSSAFMAFSGLKLSIILVVLLTMGIDNHW